MYKRFSRALALAFIVAVISSPNSSWAGPIFTTIAIEGDASPGVAGGTFTSFSEALITPFGTVGFQATLAGANNPAGVWLLLSAGVMLAYGQRKRSVG